MSHFIHWVQSPVNWTDGPSNWHPDRRERWWYPFPGEQQAVKEITTVTVNIVPEPGSHAHQDGQARSYASWLISLIGDLEQMALELDDNEQVLDILRQVQLTAKYLEEDLISGKSKEEIAAEAERRGPENGPPPYTDSIA